jgi:hypothetical protein
MMCADGISEIVQALNFPWDATSLDEFDNDHVGSSTSVNHTTLLDGANNVTCAMIAFACIYSITGPTIPPNVLRYSRRWVLFVVAPHH